MQFKARSLTHLVQKQECSVSWSGVEPKTDGRRERRFVFHSDVGISDKPRRGVEHTPAAATFVTDSLRRYGDREGGCAAVRAGTREASADRDLFVVKEGASIGSRS